MQLQRELKKERNARVTVRVTVDKSSVNESMSQVVRDLELHSKIPGFRKGKVPTGLVLARFSKYIKDETTSRVLSGSLKQVLGEEPFRPISDPVVVEMGELEKDRDFSYRAQFDVMPEFTLPEYKGIPSEKYEFVVRDEDVAREVENLRERFATLVTKEGRSEDGDYLVIDAEEFDTDGKPRSKKSDQTVVLDVKNDALSGKLAGMVKGDETTVPLPLEGRAGSDDPASQTADGNPDEERGKPGTLRVLVKEVKKKELPEPNDDFARDISDAESMDGLRKKIREELERTAGRRGEEKTKEALVTELVERTGIELPETLVNNEFARLLANIATAYRIDPKKLTEDPELVQRYRKNLTPRAVRNVKYELIMNEIAKREGIEVSDGDVDEEIGKYARAGKRDFQSVMDDMVRNDAIPRLRVRLMQNKALDLVYRSARFTKTREMHLDERGGNE